MKSRFGDTLEDHQVSSSRKLSEVSGTENTSRRDRPEINLENAESHRKEKKKKKKIIPFPEANAASATFNGY